jgi:hypothetical protein
MELDSGLGVEFAEEQRAAAGGVEREDRSTTLATTAGSAILRAGDWQNRQSSFETIHCCRSNRRSSVGIASRREMVR